MRYYRVRPSLLGRYFFFSVGVCRIAPRNLTAHRGNVTILQRWKQTALHNKALVLTGLIVAMGTIVSTGTVIVQVCITRENNKQTSEQIAKLIDAANTQVGSAQKIADASNRNASAAEGFSKSADAINTQTTKAVKEFSRLADSTKRAAQTAEDTLHVSERAYIGVTYQPIDYDKSVISMNIVNDGRIPSGRVDMVSYEATFNPPNITMGQTSFEYIVERHKGITHFDVIPASSTPVISMAFPIPQMSRERLAIGTQLVILVGTITYNDGFPTSQIQRMTFCTQTVYQTVAKTVYLAPCNAKIQLPKFEVMDWNGLTTEYP